MNDDRCLPGHIVYGEDCEDFWIVDQCMTHQRDYQLSTQSTKISWELHVSHSSLKDNKDDKTSLSMVKLTFVRKITNIMETSELGGLNQA
jgi:hypothetical protein